MKWKRANPVKSSAKVQVSPKNIARVQNCPDVTILNSLFVLCFFVSLSFCLFVFLSLCLFVFLSLCFCPLVFLSFCIFVFLCRHHADQVSEGSQVSKVTICVEIPKWQ